jgi:hypothetical protein
LVRHLLTNLILAGECRRIHVSHGSGDALCIHCERSRIGHLRTRRELLHDCSPLPVAEALLSQAGDQVIRACPALVHAGNKCPRAAWATSWLAACKVCILGDSGTALQQVVNPSTAYRVSQWRKLRTPFGLGERHSCFI